MNILYVTCLDGRPWAGPTYSVPKQIEAQFYFDNVFWYNLKDVGEKDWVIWDWKKLPYYHDVSDFPNQKLSSLPYPFNKPDLIIIEQFYDFVFSKLIYEIVTSGIPYIVVPRGELTRSAQSIKSFKKQIANFCFFNKFAKNAIAIQYLTEQEYTDSSDKWNKNHIIIPNGSDSPTNRKVTFSIDGINIVSIGRLDPFHKGLDLMIEACNLLRNQLSNVNCKITIYGPDRLNKKGELENIVKSKKLDDIIAFKTGLYGEEKIPVLLDADIFIMTSRFEGHPTALLEALSYGIPCVVTTGTNMAKEIYDSDAGWIAENDSNSIASALEHAILEKDKYSIKSKNALILAKNYEWDSIAYKSHRIYERLLGHS